MSEWRLYEVFVRSKHGLNHKHVGSVHAADAEMAMENARDLYTRRNEGVRVRREGSALRSVGRQGLPARFLLQAAR